MIRPDSTHYCPGSSMARTISQNDIDSAIDSGLNVISAPTTSRLYFTLDTAMEPFTDPRVLETLNYAIDRRGIAGGLYEGFCTPHISPWPSTSLRTTKRLVMGGVSGRTTLRRPRSC